MADDVPHSEVPPLLGADADALIKLNQTLASLRIDNTIKLPSIVVLGDQSTGKSSLIERISKIKVPKAAGLCTRNPIRIQISGGRPGSKEWECSIHIEEHYTYDTTPKNKRISKTNPFGPWQKVLEPSTTLVETTRDPDKLLDLIQAAQNLILDPSRKQGSLESSTDGHERFSPNVILINISCGDWPNLSFVDLPGVIQVSERGQPEYYTRLVENLARKWARDDNTCVLLVLPMVHDVSNSKSYAIVQSEDAQNHTMAVFTKPDLAQEEQKEDYLTKYFRGENEEEFEHGYFAVMLQSDMGSDDHGREAEATFFSSKPWSTLTATTQKRFGAENLVSKLREILVEETGKAIPENLEKINVRITEVEKKLKEMPAPPDEGELPYKLGIQITIFSTNVEKLFASAQDKTSISSRKNLMEIMRAFDKRIQVDTPGLVCRSESETEEMEEVQAKLEEDAATNPTEAVGSPAGKTSNKTARSSHRFTLDEIRELNKDYYQSSVPGDIELRAVEAMHLRSVESWEGTFDLFMRRIAKVIQSEMLACVHTSLDKLKHLPVHEEIEKITTDYLHAVIQKEHTRLGVICKAEMNHPLSFDDARIKAAEENAYKKKSKLRSEKRLELEKKSQKADGLASKKKKELTIDDLVPDPWDVEVRMAAKTTAYYEVASHRFVDTICQNIFAIMLPQIRNGSLINHITHHLGLDNIERNRPNIVALMTEDIEHEKHRRRLVSELERLKAGYASICNVFETLQRSRFQHIPQTVDEIDMMAFENEHIANGSATRPSPGKRRITEADFETGDEAPFGSPSKRIKHTPRTGGRQSHLPSRGRSVDTVEEMDEDE